jgi:predicted PurR-regulated permease PerM
MLMTGEQTGLRTMIGVSTAILVAVALHLGQALFVPLVFALFTIAMVWPMQRALQSMLPPGIAMLLTLLATLVVVGTLGFAIAWGFGRVAQWVVNNAGQLQALYADKAAWLEARGVSVEGVLAEQFDARRLVGVAQGVLAQLRGILAFLVVTLVYVLLGLLEVDAVASQLARRQGRPAASAAREGLRRGAEKLRTYMAVRTLASALTGLAIWGFAEAMGLELAAEWGVIAFVVNYIPFLGSLIATVLPTFVALLQFGDPALVLTVFVVIQAIQFVMGSVLEPRLTGRQLSLSPVMVLVAVFLGSLLWGIPGAFIGVPVLIVALAVCEQVPGSRWVADLLSGKPAPPE